MKTVLTLVSLFLSLSTFAQEQKATVNESKVQVTEKQSKTPTRGLVFGAEAKKMTKTKMKGLKLEASEPKKLESSNQ